MLRRRRTALAALAGLLTVPLLAAVPALAGSDAAGPENAHALPAHSQRPVCGPPAVGNARCHAHVVTQPDGVAPLATGSYQNGFAPADLKAAYQLPTLAGNPGSGPTVAIVDAYDNPNAEADLAAYRVQFGLGPCASSSSTSPGCFTKVNQTGGSTPPAGNTGWGSEIDLDIEMVSAACPACKILLVEANSNGFGDLMTAVSYAANHASFVSNSYGGGEFSSETSYDGNFSKPGVAFTVSSGDNGYGVEYPAASRNVTAVGGTSLTHATSARGWNETTWSGAGSGCSAYETKPSWQQDTGCTRRTVADVSAVADPNTGVAVYDSYGSQGGANWFVYGGTSVAAPFVAGVWALTGTAPSNPVAQTPYLRSTGWFDVTSGANTNRCRAGYLCQAMTGFDGPTGLGTPIGATGFGGSTGGGGGGNTPPTASFTSSCTGLSCTFTDTSTDLGGSVVSWSWNFGDGGTSSLQNPTHTYGAANTYTVGLTVTDNDGATNSTSHSVVVTAPGGLTLTARGYKVKGVNTVDLSWTGSSSVDILRGAAVIVHAKSGSSYTDNVGTKGAATYTYQVCSAGTTTCSNTATVSF
jgi:subtilase family serine protease